MNNLDRLPVELFNIIVEFLDPITALYLAQTSRSVRSKFYELDSQRIKIIRSDILAFLNKLLKARGSKDDDFMSEQFRLLFNALEGRNVDKIVKIRKEFIRILFLNYRKHWLSPFTLAIRENRIVLDEESAYLAFQYARDYGYFELLVCLSFAPNVKSEMNPRRVAFLACGSGPPGILRAFLKDPRYKPSGDEIICACVRGRIDKVGLLLEDSRIDPACNGNLPILAASKCGNSEVVELLLQDPRVDPSARNNLALKWAKFYCAPEEREKVIEVLLKDPRVDPSVVDDLSIERKSTAEETKVNTADNSIESDAEYQDMLDQMHVLDIRLTIQYPIYRYYGLSSSLRKLQ